MKYSVFAMLLFVAIGCTNINEETIKTAIIGQNYYFLNKDSVSIPVEFLENCARHYDWTVNVLDEWSVKEVDGKPVLVFDTHEFEPKQMQNDELAFFCAKTGESLKKAPAGNFDINQLNGSWVNALYADLELAKTNKLQIPDCPDGNLKNPGFSFSADNKCVIQDFCDSSELPYSVNASFKMVCIGDPCKPVQVWKIREIAADKMVIDRKYLKDDKFNYEYNQWLLKR